LLGHCESSRWTFTAEALLLERSTAQPLNLLFVPAAADIVVLNVADLGFSFESGPRISISRRLHRDWSLEVSYFGIDGWTSSAVRSGNPVILFPPGVLLSTQFAVEYGSGLDSTEANLRRRCTGCLDLLMGLRWVELHEGFHVVGPNTLPLLPDLRYDTQTGDSIYGIQIGADARIPDCDPLRVDGFIKAGIYANHARQQTSTVSNLGLVTTAGDRDDHTAFLGEIGLTAAYRLGDYLTARGGYQAMWIEGVALAPDQIPFTDVLPFSPGTATLNTSGSLFYHGCYVGLEARW
jgi:hypothetical protein